MTPVRTHYSTGGTPVMTEYRNVVYCNGRSTPPEFDDCATVRDNSGREWTYSEPADVWSTRDPATTFVVHTSSRSWQRLVGEFGPLTAAIRS